jgi:hypothetical protein
VLIGTVQLGAGEAEQPDVGAAKHPGAESASDAGESSTNDSHDATSAENAGGEGEGANDGRGVEAGSASDGDAVSGTGSANSTDSADSADFANPVDSTNGTNGTDPESDTDSLDPVDSADPDSGVDPAEEPESTLVYYQVVFLQEDLASGTAGGRTYNYAQSTGRLEKLIKEGEAFTLSPEELAAAGVPLVFTGFSYERMGQPTLQDDGSYLVTMYYDRNSYYLRLHGWNWSRNDYTPIALGDDAYNVTRVFKYGESLMAFRQSDPLGKTWSLTRAPAGSSMTPTTQQQFTLPTAMPDPSEYRGDHALFVAGQNEANTLDLWDFMSSFGAGAKERYENRVYVYLEKAPVLVDGLSREGESDADGGGAGDTGGTGDMSGDDTGGTGGASDTGGKDGADAYLPAKPPFFDVTLMTGQQETARNAYLEEMRPGFTVNRALTSGAWLAGPGASVYRPGSPPTWGNTSGDANQPAQYLDIYYDRKTVLVDFYLDWGGAATTISGKYEEPLFGEVRTDIAAIQVEADKREQEFLGWYTSPDGFGGVRVDNAFLLGFLSVFPAENLSLFAHWGASTNVPEPPDQPDLPDSPDLPVEPIAPEIPETPNTPNLPAAPSKPDESVADPAELTLGAQDVSSALSRPPTLNLTKDAFTTPQNEPQGPNGADRANQAAVQTVIDQIVPLSGLFTGTASFVGLGQSPESWSFGNGALCLMGLAEAALVLGTYLRRIRRRTTSANKMALLLRGLVVCLSLIALTATGLSSSFAKPAVFLDAASPAIVMLFGIQQVVFFSLRQAEKTAVAEGVRRKRFRALRRLEGSGNSKVHKKP